MATYLQGVQDYIPQFQPYQPDLNLYANVLQTKQTQYDTAYKSLNKVYGQYFYSDLTRDSNIERKDEILKNIDFNLQRVSGLDLSLDQNVEQAVQVFKPFYEDKFMMKDMAWTKNYAAQKQRAAGLKNSNDEKLRAQYWDTGVKAMDYRREEFKNLSDDASLGYGNVEYTNYVNTQREALKLAKEAGLSIETVKFSDDPNKSWIIKTKNGDQLMEPLSKLFESTLGSDPAIQAVYKTQAYVNRKDYAYSNAAQFDGDQNAAEMSYLEDSFNVLKEKNVQRYNQLKVASQTYDAKIASVENAIKNGNAAPGSQAYLQQLLDAKDINDKVLSRAEAQNEDLEERSGTATTSTGFQNPYGDLESLRYKVDNGMASLLMQKDLDESAQIFAFQNAKQDVEANPYAVNEQKFRQEQTLANMRGSYMLKAAEARNRGERANNDRKWKQESGAYYLDEETGEMVPIASMNYTYEDKSNVGKGSATGVKNMKVVSESIMKQRTNEYAIPWAQNMTGALGQLLNDGVISKKDVEHILNGNTNRNLSLNDFNSKVQNSPNVFLRKDLNANVLKNINNRFQYWLKTNSALPQAQEVIKQTAETNFRLGDYVTALEDDNNWRIKSSQDVEKSFATSTDSDIKKFGKYLYDNEGNLRSQDQFYDAIGYSKPTVKGAAPRIAESTEPYKVPVWQQILSGGSAAGKQGAGNISLNEKNVGINYKDLDGIYSKLVGAAGKAYANSKVTKEPPPGIGRYGSYSKGTGLFTPGVTAIDVSLKAHNSKGNIFFQQFANDHFGLDYNDPTKVAVSFSGATKGAFDAVKDDPSINDVGRALVDQIIAESKDNKTKFTHFTMASQKLAANDASKGAMIIKPDMAWLKQYVGGLDKEGGRTNLLTQDEANQIMKNGITIMADSSNFNNGLFKGSDLTPLESTIAYNDNGYTMDSPYGNGTWNIKQNKYNTGTYSTEMKFKVWDPNTNKYTEDITTDNFSSTASADVLRDKAFENFQLLNQYNTQASNGGR
jgi:hypothetical protein